ncbi:MAG: hypothetical protein KG012_06015 [Deltaproteobacteria bacterium]|jgi:chromosome segregation ATPase|nr:hypothetical protein [Deltaproteobacteria bacterium]
MEPITKKDLTDALIEFYGELIEPQFNKIGQKLEEHDKKFADLSDHFDQIYQRLDRLETEYYTITIALQRIEERLDRVEGQLGRMEGKLDKEIALKERLEKEITDLKQRVFILQSRIEELENNLKTIS